MFQIIFQSMQFIIQIEFKTYFEKQFYFVLNYLFSDHLKISI